MQPKRSKYDTNPLEEDVVRRAEESFGASGAGSTAEISAPTKPIAGAAQTSRVPNQSEEPTRRIDQVTSYPSVFVPPAPRPTTYEPPRVAAANVYQPPPGPPPAIYQSPGLTAFEKSGQRNVAGIGIPERWAAILPYMPFSAWLGIVLAVIELFMTPRTETRVRFHASQALVLQAAIAGLSTLLTFIGFVTSSKFTGAWIVGLAGLIFRCVAVAKVWKGLPFAITALEEPRQWLDEKIKPRK
jgi:uncharacterized membrane protein